MYKKKVTWFQQLSYSPLCLLSGSTSKRLWNHNAMRRKTWHRMIASASHDSGVSTSHFGQAPRPASTILSCWHRITQTMTLCFEFERNKCTEPYSAYKAYKCIWMPNACTPLLTMYIMCAFCSMGTMCKFLHCRHWVQCGVYLMQTLSLHTLCKMQPGKHCIPCILCVQFL